MKSTATFGERSALRKARNSFSTAVQSETRLLSILSARNEIMPFPSPPKCSGISRFHNDRHRHVWCLSRGDNTVSETRFHRRTAVKAGLVRAKSVAGKCPPAGVAWKFRDWVASWSAVLVI
ncbi:hypothetical protein AVEN_121493-1 [Araneus ventricosus]|uniref:Uncharacterized protein n=1 Tax=Araneus ventricosus TaxID=182803 RepID=A0A4Y2K733_ARAVE|nr:hypothetical protein AVEN_121493-1 [Araneus ventricosus]